MQHVLPHIFLFFLGSNNFFNPDNRVNCYVAKWILPNFEKFLKVKEKPIKKKQNFVQNTQNFY